MWNRVFWALGLVLFACSASSAAELPCASEPTNMSISAGDSVVCSVEEVGDEDSFRFMGSAGQRILIQGVRHDGGNPCVELFDPGGTRLAAQCHGQAARIDQTLNSAGEHLIRVSEWDSNSTLTYRLSLESLAPPSPTSQAIQFGEAATSGWDTVGGADLFRFTAAAGQVVLIQAVRHGGGNPCVELFDSAGMRLASQCHGQAARIDQTLSSAGEYLIRVSEWDSNSTLTYRLSLESLAPSSPTSQAIQFGEAATSGWDAVGGAELFRFTAASGQLVLIQAVRHGGGNPCVELFDSAGMRLASQCHGQAARIDQTLNSAGEYVIRVSEWDSNSTLTYRLSLERLAPPSPTAQPLQFGEAAMSGWDAVGGAELFRFTAASGQLVLIQAVRHGGGNPCVELFDSAGMRLASQCHGQAARIDQTLSSAGEYLIRVSEWDSNSTLTYRLSLESLAPPSPTAQPLQFGLGTIGELATVGEAHLFVVAGVTGDRIEPVATRQSAGNPCVEVFDPTGSRIASVCHGQSARTGFLTLAAAGPHVIRVSEWDSNATLGYRIEVQCQGTCPPPPVIDGPPTAVTELSVDPGALFFTFSEGAAGSVRLLKVRNTGSDPAQISVEASTLSGGNWLAAVPESAPLDAGQSVSLSVRANPAGLEPGTFSGRITVRDSRGGNPVQAFVTMSVSRATRSLLLSQTGLTFSATEGGENVAQMFELLNLGVGDLDWSLDSSTLSGGDWLTVSPNSGSTPPESPGSGVEVTIDPNGLAPGVYYGQVSVTAPEADNSPQSLTVVLNLLPADSPPAPEIDPAGLVFVGQPGVPGPEPQTISLFNPGNSPVMFAATASFEGGPEWFSVDPVNGVITGGESATIEVRPDATQLERGVFRGRVTFEFDGGFSAEAGLLLVVAPAAAAPLSLSSTEGRKQQAACTAEQLLPVFATPANSFRVQAGWPTPIEVVVVDDCGRALNDGAVQVSFSNGDAPLSLTPQGRGRWGRTWPARPSQQLNEVVVTADAVQFEPLLRGSSEIGGELSLEVDAPIVGGGAIISAASFDTAAPLAPGDLISIFGQRLAAAEDTSASLPLAKELSGTVVSLAGRRIPLLFVSENQINGMVPYGLPVNVEHEVVVRRGNAYALPSPVVLADAQPAVFTRDQTGSGQGIVVNAQGVLTDAANPVSAGDLVLIFGAGFGEADPAIEAGEAVPSDPLSTTKHPVTVTIGGIAAVVHFAGPTPGFTGLYQINATVPAGVPIGDNAPVIVSVSGRPGPPVTIAVR